MTKIGRYFNLSDLKLKKLCLHILVRTCSTNKNCCQSQTVRVRFAPSPTGSLHLGGLRTALYNYLFAKSNGGKFILRIEDTDQTRLVPKAAETLENTLKWSGLEPDESPNVGGPYGPYFQSERLTLYKEKVNELVGKGSAYYCFCTVKRLELLRKEAIRNREIPKYDNQCRNLSKEEVQSKLKQGLQHCIRFKLEPYHGPFHDLVYGPITCNIAEIEGDPVIIKADGFPTYHFANVVDDHLMKITHVLRGVEWQVSTVKHILLYKAFGWEMPAFGHLPLIVNADGTKLSKRQKDIDIEYFQKRGIYPTALLNFVTSIGGGFGLKKQHVLTLDQLVKNFNLYAVNTNSCKLLLEEVDQYNRLEIKRQLQDDKMVSALVDNARSIIQQKLEVTGDLELQLNDDHIESVLQWSQDRICAVSELVGPKLNFLWVRPRSIELSDGEKPYVDAVANVRELLSRETDDRFKKEVLIEVLRTFSEKSGTSFSTLMKVLRKVLSGLHEGPPVAEMMEILGKKNTLSRLDHSVDVLKQVACT